MALSKEDLFDLLRDVRDNVGGCLMDQELRRADLAEALALLSRVVEELNRQEEE